MIDLDRQIIEAAFKRAGVILCKMNGAPSTDPIADFVAAIRKEIAYQKQQQWNIAIEEVSLGSVADLDARIADAPKNKQATRWRR